MNKGKTVQAREPNAVAAVYDRRFRSNFKTGDHRPPLQHVVE